MVLSFDSQVIAIIFSASSSRTLYHWWYSLVTPAFSEPTIQGQDSVSLRTLNPKLIISFLLHLTNSW